MIQNVSLPFLRLYWRVFKPKTFGVKVIVQHPESEKILLAQHSYGNLNIWHLPGGGYNPKRESAVDAARREVFEELGVELVDLTFLADYQTSAEGKQDTVSIFTAVANSVELALSNEIKSAKWFDPSGIPTEQIYKITRFALDLYIPFTEGE
ncbi:MAG: NUDIX domain-containing protein [Chloroflexota bacterium]